MLTGWTSGFAVTLVNNFNTFLLPVCLRDAQIQKLEIQCSCMVVKDLTVKVLEIKRTCTVSSWTDKSLGMKEKKIPYTFS